MALCQGCGQGNDEITTGDTQIKTNIFNSHMHSAFVGMEDAPYRAQLLEEMDQHGIVMSVLHINETSDVRDWVDAEPGRFLAGPAFPCWKSVDGSQRCDWDGRDWPDLNWLRAQYESGKLQIMGELLLVYTGIAPTDARMTPYWDLAAELDIPVAIHINRGPPPDSPVRPTGCCPNFDADLGNPELLRPILEKYPSLRVWLQHAGFPQIPGIQDTDYLEETFAILRDFPNVYVDMTALNAVPPPPVHIEAVKLFIERGFGDRIMMGTDNWEAAPIIERYKNMSFLSDEQRQGILYDNAARFFRINEKN